MIKEWNVLYLSSWQRNVAPQIFQCGHLITDHVKVKKFDSQCLNMRENSSQQLEGKDSVQGLQYSSQWTFNVVSCCFWKVPYMKNLNGIFSVICCVRNTFEHRRGSQKVTFSNYNVTFEEPFRNLLYKVTWIYIKQYSWCFTLRASRECSKVSKITLGINS